jgi:ankyrin repeat protein/beta-lactamase regulating signal transducer with metallopeptidase domain
MTSLLIPGATVERLAGVLLHFVWQGAAIALVAAVALRLLRRRAPEWRYATASAALVAMLLAPLVTFVFQAELGALTLRLLRRANEAAMQAASGVATADIAVWTQRIVMLWVLGVAILFMRLLGGWLLSRRLVRSASVIITPAVSEALQRARTGLRFDPAVRLLTGAHVETPMVIGWLRPAILLPASALTGLTPDQLLAIIAHELAHVRRRDFLVNALQRVVECLLFYHPAVWWVSGRIRLERERCCDDLAVGVCGNRLVYAQALEAIERARAALPTVAVAGAGMGVRDRVRRILGVDGADRDWQSAVAATAFAAILVGAGTWQPPILAEPTMHVASQGPAGTAQRSAGASEVTTPNTPLRTLVAIAAADGSRASAGVSAQQPVTAATSTVPQPSIAASREAAREKLGRLRVEYSAESFVKQAAEGDTIAVKTFLAAGMDINARGESNYTALIKAAEAKQVETVQALLAAGANPNLFGGSGDRTALHAAARQGHVPVMQVLLKAGARPDAQSTSVMFSSLGGQTESSGDTPLMEAALAGHLAAVVLLLDNKASVDAKSDTSGTALAAAARTGRLEVVRTLLDRGADVNARMVNTAYTPLFAATERPHLEVMQLLLDGGADVNALSEATRTSVPFITGVTPLLYALSKGTPGAAAALLLIQRGADVNVVSPRGETALGLATSKDMTDVVRALLEKGANPDGALSAQAGTDATTPLLMALTPPFGKSGAATALLLIEGGADVNAVRRRDGMTPLILALQTNQDAVVRALLARGANPNLTNALGLTPLEVASREEMRQLLIKAGARP